LNDLIRVADLPEESLDEFRGESDSLAGLILEINGTFPKAGESVTADHLEFIIESITPSRIKRVRMIIHPTENED
jgi:CBS domain containing-hemolysin-like protein